MARTNKIEQELTFHSLIRGHHKSLHYMPSKDHFLYCHKDESDGAQSIDPDSIGVYHDDSIIGHMPIEISNLMNYFLQLGLSARLSASPTGKRIRNKGLSIPCTYTATGTSAFNINILKKELKKISESNNSVVSEIKSIKTVVIN